MNQINTNELTQRDLQVLSAMLKEQISYCESKITDHKENVAWQFSLCDPENKDTFGWFESLNYNKDMQRDFRNRKNKLAEIQRKIKRQIANG